MSASFPSGPTGRRVESYGYLICLVIFAAYFLAYFHRVSPAVLALDMQRDFQAGGALLGLLGSAYFYPYALMQFPVGLLADSWGPRKTVASFLVLAAAGSALMGLAPEVVLAMAGRVLVGLGVSTIFVCNFKLLAEWFEPRRFLFLGGVFQAVGGLGALSASAPLAYLSLVLGWRMSLVLVGAVTLGMALLVWLVVRDRPSALARPAEAEAVGQGRRPERIPLWAGVRQVVSAGRFWCLSLWSLGCVGISFALGGLWGGPFLMHVYGLDKAGAGQVLSMFALALIFGGPINGYLANRFGRKPVLVGASVIMVLACGLVYLKPQDLPVPVLYLLFFLFSLCGACTGPVVAATSKELFPIAIAGTSVGLVNLFPFLGTALFQVAMGVVVAASGQANGLYAVAGYRNMFMFCLIVALVSLAMGFFIVETLPRPARRRR